MLCAHSPKLGEHFVARLLAGGGGGFLLGLSVYESVGRAMFDVDVERRNLGTWLGVLLVILLVVFEGTMLVSLSLYLMNGDNLDDKSTRVKEKISIQCVKKQ